MRRPRPFWAGLTPVLVTCVLLGPAGRCHAAPADKALRDEWFAIYLQDKKVGYHHVKTSLASAKGRDLYVTESQDRLSISRAGTAISFKVSCRIEEDTEGRLVSFRREMVQGPVKQITSGGVKGGRLVLTAGEGESVHTSEVPIPEGLPPWAAELFAKKKGYRTGTSYSLKVFMAETPDTSPTVSIRIGDVEKVNIFGVTKWLHRVTACLDILPGVPTTHWVDDEGVAWLSEVNLGVFKVMMAKVNRSAALTQGEPAEIFLQTAVTPDRPIPRPRSLERLRVLVLPVSAGGKKLDIPQGPHQELRKSKEGLMLSIRRAHPSPELSYPLPYHGKEYAHLLKPSPWLEIEDPLILRMSNEAVGGETDALAAARKIEKYVNEKIAKKNLSLGFATAAEAAKQKAGDCTEHAMLVAALARAAGIPSRLVSGLAYAAALQDDRQGKFYYHMWTEVFAGEWLPLDAALGGHDATHIVVSRRDFNSPGDMFKSSADLLQVLGKIRIKVLEFE